MKSNTQQIKFSQPLIYPGDQNWFAKVQKICNNHRILSPQKMVDKFEKDPGKENSFELIECNICHYWFYPEEL